MAKDTTRTEAAELDLEENARQIKEAREKLEKDTAEKKGKYAAFMQKLPEEEQAKNSPVYASVNAKLFQAFFNNPLEKAGLEAELEAENLAAIAWKTWLKDRFLWDSIKEDENTITSVINGLSFAVWDFNNHLELYKTHYQYDPEKVEHYDAQLKTLKETADMFPFLVEELKKPIYGGKCPAELYNEAQKDKNGQPVKNSLYVKAYTAALKALKGENAPKEKTKKINTLPLESLIFPKDKVNAKIWNLPDTGNIKASFDIIKQSRKRPALVAQYSINFDFLDDNIKHQLTPFDKRVFVSAATLFLNGETEFSFTRLYYAIGGKTGTKPTTEALTKLYNSLAKLGAARTWLALPKEKNSKYEGFKIEQAPILEFRLSSDPATIKGGEANITIIIKEKPLLVEFAENLGQITRIDLKLFQDIELNLTDDNLALEDYIINFITWQKHENNNRAELALDTICKNINMTDRRQKARAATKTETILKGCKKNSFISGYKYDTSTKKFIISL